MSVFVELACERLDVGGDLGLQRRGQHLPSAVADDLIEQRPTSRLVGRRGVVNYLERGRTFPSRRANADPDPNLSMGFDLAREGTSTSRHLAERHPQVLIIAPVKG